MAAKYFLERLFYVLFGLIIALSFFVLTGADDGNYIGRYQISTELRRDFVDIYVIDTATGAVKYVEAKDENKPFEEIKSR